MTSISDLIAQYAINEKHTAHIKELITLKDSTIHFSEAGKKAGIIPFISVNQGQIQPDKNHSSVSPGHYHNYLELVFILEGEGVHLIGEHVVTVLPGQVFFINNNSPHSVTAAPAQTLSYINIAFLPEYLNSFISLDKIDAGVNFFLTDPFFLEAEGTAPVLVLKNPSFFRIASIALSLISFFWDAYPAAAEPCNHLFKAFMLEIIAQYRSFFPENSQSIKRVELFYGLLDYIKKNINDKITITDLATRADLGKTSLSRIFKQKTGTSIVNYINDIRTAKAKELLAGTGLKIIDIAVGCGYNDLSNFNRRFKERTGQTPSEFRNSL